MSHEGNDHSNLICEYINKNKSWTKKNETINKGMGFYTFTCFQNICVCDSTWNIHFVYIRILPSNVITRTFINNQSIQVNISYNYYIRKVCYYCIVKYL